MTVFWVLIAIAIFSTVFSETDNGSAGSGSGMIGSGIYSESAVFTSLDSPSSPFIAGTNRFLLCSVDSSILPVVFDWMKNSIPITTNDSRVTVNSVSQNTSSLMFNPLLTSDGGLYQCVVTELFGSINKVVGEIELNVTIATSSIVLSTIPNDTLYEYTFIDILCNVTVSDSVDTPTTIMYQWLMELTLLTTGEHYNITGDTLRINQLSRSRNNDKTITCMATAEPEYMYEYVLHSDDSASIQLTVEFLPPPDVNTTIAGDVLLGSSLTLTCEVFVIERLVLQPSILWTKQATINSITGSEKPQRINNTLTVFLSSVNTSDAGEYTCIATVNISTVNLATANSSKKVVLQIPNPNVSISIQPSLLFEDKSANITCTITVLNAYVNTPINVTTSWYGPGGLIHSNTSDYEISTVVKINDTTYTSMLLLTRLLLERDNGSSYSCSVQLLSISDPAHILSSNSSNKLRISIDILKTVPSDTVLYVPTNSSTNVSIAERATLTFSCSSHSYPPPSLVWKRRNAVLVNIGRITVAVMSFPFEKNSTKVNSTLTIQGLLPFDEGSYECVASNEKGVKRSSVQVDVREIDDCSESPCGSNGTCVDDIDMFSCRCDDNFFGTPCKPEKDAEEVDHAIKITESPQNLDVELYDMVNLTCTAESDAPFTYQWLKDDVPIRQMSDTGNLIIHEIFPSDRGVYICKASTANNSSSSSPALVTIRGVQQFNIYVDPSNRNMIRVDALLGQIAMSSVTVLSVNFTSETTLLITTWNKDKNNDRDVNFQRNLLEELLVEHNLLRLRIEIHDSCPLEVIFIAGENITWNETEISKLADHPCPCQTLTLQYDEMITRRCGGSYSNGAVWKEMDYSKCGFTDRVIELCEALQATPEIRSKLLLNVTSDPSTLVVSELIVVSVIIENLASIAAKNSVVQENYLDVISNVIDVEQDTIEESNNVSTRILSSLIRFGDEVVLDQGKKEAQNGERDEEQLRIFSRRNFALQIQDIDSNEFTGESFNVDLGSVEEAMNLSQSIDPRAIQTLASPLSNATGSLSVDGSILKNINSSKVRLGYTVFVSSSLFPTTPENTTVASVIFHLRITNFITNNDPLNITLRAIDTPASKTIDNETCASTDGLSTWNSNYCTMITKPGERPVKCSCRQPPTGQTKNTHGVYFGLLFDLSPGSEPLHQDSLVSITYVGLSSSIIALLAIIITYLTNKSLRTQDHNQIIINLSISLLALYVTFLISGHVTEIEPLCGMSAGLLHYFMLVFFSWTAVESVFLFIKLVQVVGGGISRYNLKAGLLAWIAPAPIVIISGGAGNQHYTNRFFCRPDGLPFYIGFILPIMVIFVFNWVMYFIIIASVFNRLRNAAKVTNTDVSGKKLAWTAAVLSVVCGLGWGFGLAQTSVSNDGSEAAKAVVFTLQVLYACLVGCQGVCFTELVIRKFEIFGKNYSSVGACHT